jgi:hypothetical protein
MAADAPHAPTNAIAEHGDWIQTPPGSAVTFTAIVAVAPVGPPNQTPAVVFAAVETTSPLDHEYCVGLLAYPNGPLASLRAQDKRAHMRAPVSDGCIAGIATPPAEHGVRNYITGPKHAHWCGQLCGNKSPICPRDRCRIPYFQSVNLVQVS